VIKSKLEIKMGYLSELFYKPYPSDRERDVQNMMLELFQIGREQDFLSERPGGAYNYQCRHVRTREIGRQLNEIGGLELMKWIHRKVQKKLSKIKAEHLEYAWDGVGHWQA
jgi:hypothetical protein